MHACPLWLRLLEPWWRGLVHGPAAASHRRKVAGAVFALLGVGFWLAIFFATRWFFDHCLDVELVGALLVRKVLDMAFLVFLSVLIFSNLIASFSTFFLAEDLDLLMALPVHTDSLYLARLAETILHSSWMILIFGLPILGAAGVSFGAPWRYYGIVVLVLPAFVVIPSVVGSSITIGLVMLFPARRARDLLGILGLIGFSVLFILFRLLRPERLLDDSQFKDMVSFLAAFRTPQAQWLPSSWAIRAIFPALRSMPGAGLDDLGMLYLSAAALLVLGTWLARPLYRRAYSRSREGRVGTCRPRSLASLRLPRPRSPVLSILLKDLRVFMRDPSQWSQILLLLAVVVVYLVNFKNFEVLSSAGIIGELGLYHINLGLTGFVMAAMGARLIFPSVSLEGRAFWLLASAPISMERVLKAKLLGGLIPSLLVGTITIGATGLMLRTSTELMVVSLLSVWGLALLVAGMGTGLGALYPSFDAQNATSVAAGYGGIIYMILTMSLTIGVIMLQAWPIYLLHRTLVLSRSFPLRYWALGLLLGMAAVLVIALASWLPMRLGARNLRSSR